MIRPLALAMTLVAAHPALAAAQQACDVRVDITDTDPRGTHVRSTPGGTVIAALRNSGDGWIGVHVTGLFGDWYRIDHAELFGSDLPADGKTIFRGSGYLHKSVLGLSGMQNGGVIYADHDRASHPVDPYAAGDQQVDLLGCWGNFLKVHVAKGTGWTQTACTNMNTTCS